MVTSNLPMSSSMTGSAAALQTSISHLTPRTARQHCRILQHHGERLVFGAEHLHESRLGPRDDGRRARVQRVDDLRILLRRAQRELVRALARPPLALILAALAIAWTCLSFAWSPYDRPDQAIKLALLTPLFLALPFFAGQLGETDRARVRPFVIFAAASSLLFLTIEALLQAPVTLSYKLDVEGYAPDHGAILDLSHRMLSRGAVPALMLAGPAALLL